MGGSDLIQQVFVDIFLQITGLTQAPFAVIAFHPYAVPVECLIQDGITEGLFPVLIFLPETGAGFFVAFIDGVCGGRKDVRASVQPGKAEGGKNEQDADQQEKGYVDKEVFIRGNFTCENTVQMQDEAQYREIK